MNTAGATPIIGQSEPEPAETPGPEELHVRTAFVTYVTDAGEIITSVDQTLLADRVFIERPAHPDEVFSAFKRGLDSIERQELIQGIAVGVHQLNMAAAQHYQQQAESASIARKLNLRR